MTLIDLEGGMDKMKHIRDGTHVWFIDYDGNWNVRFHSIPFPSMFGCQIVRKILPTVFVIDYESFILILLTNFIQRLCEPKAT